MVMNELFDSRHECMYINYIYDIILITFLHKNNLMANNNEFKEEFKGLVNPTTPYEWWKDIIKQQDIQEWEKENKKKVMSLYDHKRKAKIDMYYWTYYRYEKQLKKFESKQSEDPELLDEIYKLQDRLHNNYLKKVE